MAVSITLKQLEALYWIANMGTFEKAAIKLNTTQSAVSKRIQELETLTQMTIFDRSQRGARLTERGEYLVAIASDMLKLGAKVEGLKENHLMPVYRLRFGVTELTTITWLPSFISELRCHFPTVTLLPEVDLSRNLYEKLQDGTLDFIVIPETFSDPDVTSIFLENVPNAWVAKPGLVDIGHPVHLAELVRYPILSQGTRSGSGLYFNKWLKGEGISFETPLVCDSMTALLGFAMAGLGIAYTPKDCFQSFLDDRKLEAIATIPELPPVPYCAMYRNDRPYAITRSIVDIVKQVCDFSKPYQTGQ